MFGIYNVGGGVWGVILNNPGKTFQRGHPPVVLQEISLCIDMIAKNITGRKVLAVLGWVSLCCDCDCAETKTMSM